MTRLRCAIFVFLSLCSALSLFWGFAAQRAARGVIIDFKVVYLDTRCLLEKHDPYDQDQLVSFYMLEGENPPSNPADLQRVRQVIALLYLPTALLYFAPFALLPFGAAHAAWSCVTAVILTAAAFLMWILSQDRAPNAAFYLACFVLANSGILYAGGNPAGLAIGLCLVGTWCFLREKYVYLGITCFAVSLGIKSHDTGFVWLYFLLAGGTFRKRALQTLALTILLALPTVLWVSNFSPHWMRELSGNIAATSVSGGVNDPSPSAMSENGGAMIIDLRTVVNVFSDDPGVYNPISYAICGSLLLIWIVITLRSRPTIANQYLALAAIGAFSMLPVYHRPHDAKILLLTLPACATLLSEGGLLGYIALCLNSAAIALTSDIPVAALSQLTGGLHLSTQNWHAMLLTVLLGRPMPMVLLLLGTFYLWIYTRRASREAFA